MNRLVRPLLGLFVVVVLFLLEAAFVSQLAFGQIGLGSSITATPAVPSLGNTAPGQTASAPRTPANSGGATRFSSASPGSLSGSLDLAPNRGNPNLTVALASTSQGGGALVLSPSVESFGYIVLGSSRSADITLSNIGTASVTVSGYTSTSSWFSLSGISFPLTLSPGQSTIFTVTATPQAASVVDAYIYFANDGSTPSLPLHVGAGGGAGTLVSADASVAFGTVIEGQNSALQETVSNTGKYPVVVSQVSVSGSGFSLTPVSVPFTLAVGESAVFSLGFAPTTNGTFSGALVLASNATNPAFSIPLAGTGVAPPGTLVLTPTVESFGYIVLGSSRSVNVTLSNAGATNVTVSGYTSTSPWFTISGITFPLTLAGGESVTFALTATPDAVTAVDGHIYLANNGVTPSLPLHVGAGGGAGTLVSSSGGLNFGTLVDGQTVTLQETISNTGKYPVTISKASVGGAGFGLAAMSLPVTIQAGQSALLGVTFAPVSAGSLGGALNLTSNATNSVFSIPLAGVGQAPSGTLSLSPTIESFGYVLIGSSRSADITMSNAGTAGVTVSGYTSTSAWFSLSGITVPFTLDPGQSLTFTVNVAPPSVSVVDAYIYFANSGTTPELPLHLGAGGKTPGSLDNSPQIYDFGNVTTGSTANTSATITASGPNVTISSASTTDPEFTITGLTLPLTLADGQSATFQLHFAPTASGATSALVSLLSNAGDSPTSFVVSGIGIAPNQHTVALSWNPSSSGVSGYNVYRGTQSGGPYSQINPVLEGGTFYSDATVQNGKTYYYTVTSVDESGSESIPSNEVKAVVPTS